MRRGSARPLLASNAISGLRSSAAPEEIPLATLPSRLQCLFQVIFVGQTRFKLKCGERYRWLGIRTSGR